MFCQQQVAQLRDVVNEIRSRGAELVVVGNGGVEQARAFRAEQKLPFPLYTDPSLESYRLAGLRHGPGSSLHPRVALHAVTAMRQGFRQSRTQGDPVQQGGVFVIPKGGGLIYQYVSREAGDHPDNANVLRALDEDAASRKQT
jgi:peroxiredoxin